MVNNHSSVVEVAFALVAVVDNDDASVVVAVVWACMLVVVVDIPIVVDIVARPVEVVVARADNDHRRYHCGFGTVVSREFYSWERSRSDRNACI